MDYIYQCSVENESSLLHRAAASPSIIGDRVGEEPGELIGEPL
jgi:hypothetical protein